MSHDKTVIYSVLIRFFFFKQTIYSKRKMKLFVIPQHKKTIV